MIAQMRIIIETTLISRVHVVLFSKRLLSKEIRDEINYKSV